MQFTIIWQQGSSNPENGNNLAAISQWWASLHGKEIFWQQRLIAQATNASELNWEAQRFDEKFLISNSQIRGITLYWRKPDSQQERSTTPHKLELDTLHQQLYIYPQSQRDIVIKVGIPNVVYQTIELKNPQVEVTAVGEIYSLILRDQLQQIEVKAILSPEAIKQLNQL